MNDTVTTAGELATQPVADREPELSGLREAYELLIDHSLELDRRGRYRDGEAMVRAATFLVGVMIKRGEMRGP